MKALIYILTTLFMMGNLSAQKVGIGTTNPLSTLHVISPSANQEVAKFQSNGTNSYISVGYGLNNACFGYDDYKGWAGTQGPANFAIKTGGIDRMFFMDGTGNVGIGTINPLERLDVSGNIKAIGATLTGNFNCTNATMSTLTTSSAAITGGLMVGGAVNMGSFIANGNGQIIGNLTATQNATVFGTLTVSSIVQSPTNLVSFQNGFSNYGGVFGYVTYVKDKQGWVHLSGMVQIPVSYDDGLMFFLPAGYIPEYQNAFMAFNASNNSIARIDINSGGYVILEPGITGFISLCGISFKAVN